MNQFVAPAQGFVDIKRKKRIFGSPDVIGIISASDCNFHLRILGVIRDELGCCARKAGNSLRERTEIKINLVICRGGQGWSNQGSK